MNRTCLLTLFFSCFFGFAYSSPGDSLTAKKKYVTQRLSGTITLDGIPSEEAWNAVDWGGGFIQQQPHEAQAPSQPTNFKILYDDTYLYLAYRAHDASPDSIVRRMGRRDEFPGDWVEINIDSYHDGRTAFSFTLSVSGVRNDEFVSNDGGNWDTNWNPIWFAKTHVDDSGWTAEVKIPFSQLRYNNDAEKVWGIQLMRRIFRKEERSIWQYIPQNSGVWVSRFGELHGLKGIPMHRQVEIAPYLIAQADVYKKEPGNPFAEGFDKHVSGGVDGKYAVTNDLILDFTINPDFGQVEADPSQVRIDGFQSFFEERRPFFIESRNIFDYQLTGSIAGGDYDADLLFYSRRIGSVPHGYPQLNNGEFADIPQNTSILGAAKFSGKTRDGWSIGVLESVAQREMATIDNSGERRKEMVEPWTNYFVSRLQKDIKGGKTVLGGIVTGVHREKGLDDLLHRSAYTGGLDFLHQWKNRTWYVKGNMVFSHVTGTKEAILRTQTSFEHLFQRPDAPEVAVDTSLTSLSGTGGSVLFGKSGGKGGRLGQVLRFETGVTYRSPGLELNDIGFMLTTNEINYFGWAGLRYPKAFSIFRWAQINYNHWTRWDYSGKFMFLAFNNNAHAAFKNNWQVGYGLTWNPYDVSNNALRGASAVRRLAGIGFNTYVNTDTRKKVAASFNIYQFWGSDNTMKIDDITLTLSAQPLDALRISLSGSYGYNWRLQDQFVTNNVHSDKSIHTVVSQVKQETLRFTGRLSYNITPDLTVQYYGQPFITRPLYSNFAYVAEPLAKDIERRFQPYAPGQINFVNGRYEVDENNDGIPDFHFAAPDFNFVQFRSNLITRWEYRAGSELYFVWSLSNTPDAYADLHTPLAESLVENAFSQQGRNSFLIKWTYRFLK